ncbi:MAG: sigma-54-dependent Fis family transcriptional regulator [Deltaproteobacteria bacterium]|nr:sigma-54-dependent Fis family transcriptional regulator [Deltaproteobacteria bacterium]
MAVFTESERQTAADIGALGFTNPFLEDRIALERRILGNRYLPIHDYWNATQSLDENTNVVKITQMAHALLHSARTRLEKGNAFAGESEREIYRSLALFALYYVCEESFYQYMLHGKPQVLVYDAFAQQVQYYFPRGEKGNFDDVDPVHLYALYFVIRRAFHFIFRYIFGASKAVAKLRASVWESVFTSSMERYHRTMYNRMDRISTLVLGKTGTGKDLVARAIGVSRYIPFNRSKGDFVAPFAQNYFPLNLTALSPTLVEAELFGYVRGAFTGAQKDTEGFLDQGGPFCTLFLDEVGDVSADIQVKLLRVLQSGEYTRVGTRTVRRFEGKVVAATNLNLPKRMTENRFREDLYFRLCSDVISTPSLAEQIADDSSELTTIVRQLACNIAGEAECEGLTGETMTFIETHMPESYEWPGNIRELEQCVCNILVRGHYTPMTGRVPSAVDFGELLQQGKMTADELVNTYCTHVYAQTQSFVETAKRLNIDRRTVKSKVDEILLARLKEQR